MKKIFYVVIILSLVLTFMNSSGQASVNGNLIKIPEGTMINGKGEISLDISSGNGSITGVMKITDWLQAGAIINTAKNGEADIIPLAKLYVIDEYKYGVDLATGMRGDNLYLSASKSFDSGIKGHFGFGSNTGGLFLGISKVVGNEDIQIISGESGKEDNVFSSIPPIRLSAEYFDEDINLGAKANISDSLYFDIGILDFANFRAGVNYSF